MRPLIAALILATPAPALAQFGASFHLRSVSAEETDSANANRRGYEFRAHYDGHIGRGFGWRADVAAIQMQYQRDDGTLRRQISENGAELALLGTAEAQNGALTGLYALGGPVASWRVNCGQLGGFVDCDATPSQLVGYTVGVGYRSPISPRRELLFEVKFADRLVGGAGAPIVSLGIGLRVRADQGRMTEDGR
jgi:hypothetical protein